MKIGILTFHCAHNYGAVLQAYAMQEFLKSKGFETYIIDYRPYYLTRNYERNVFKMFKNWSFLGKIKRIPCEPFIFKQRAKRFDGFRNFIQNRFSLIPFTFQDLQTLDCVIYGSDQIWNPKITKYDGIFLGDSIDCKKIAYAGSSGQDTFSEEERTLIKTKLEKFIAIGVREQSLKASLSQFINIPLKTVIDPTFLCNSSIYEKIIQRPKYKRPFILIYEVVHNKNTYKLATRLAKDYDWDIIQIMGTVSINGFRKKMDLKPEEFLGYFAEAKWIVTTSFHGTAFSLIFNRQFYTIKQNNKLDLRNTSLLESLGLLDRLVDDVENLKFKEIDYHLINQELKNVREDSSSWLLNKIFQK